MKKNPAFNPEWPKDLKTNTFYQVFCDDKGRNKSSWLKVMVAEDGDVHLVMQDWEKCPDGEPSPFPSIRIRTSSGGGRNPNVRQALLWLAEAIRIDCGTEDQGEK